MVLYVDIGNKILTKSDGLNRLALPDHPQVFEGSQEMFEITFYKDGAVYPINATDTFAATLDNNFIHTDDLMASSSAFTIINASAGRVNIPMLFTAASFTAKLAGNAKITAYLDIKRYVSGETVPETFLQDTVFARASIATTEGAPETGNPEYYNSAQVNSLVSGLFDWADPYDFTTTSETGETLTFTAEDLGVESDSCDFEIIQIVGDDKLTVTNDAAISRKWTPDGYVVMYAGGWPEGTWQLRAGKVKGDEGLPGDEDGRVTVSGIALSVQTGPHEYYVTAEAGTMTIDWSAIIGVDKKIPVIITQPDPAVALVLPTVDHWFNAAGTLLESAPDISTPGEYHFEFKKYANGLIGFYLFGIV